MQYPALLASPTHLINGETTNTAGNVIARASYQGILPGSLSCQTAYIGNYNSLQTSVTRKIAHGFEVLASYTRSKTLDELSDSGGSDMCEASLVTNDRFNPRQAYGLSDFDRSYRVVLSLVYNTRPISSLPRFAQLAAANWQVSGMAVAQSGSSLAVTDSSAGAIYGNFENRVAAPTRNPLTPGSFFERTLSPPGAGYIGSSAFPAAWTAPFGSGPFDTDFGDSSVGFL
ncbi:MAG TPA: hypothetical protein VJU82_10565, partial [Acidobacteriaceae bacterium]|nr:hypothetical protein [Acidobacteriaceae bacterium]